MKKEDFEVIREKFRLAETEEKINIYINSQELTKEQYRELLKMFPINEIPRLEVALNAL